MRKAKYILIEGSEGTGKSTQCKLLVKRLQDKGYKVLETKEPGTPLSPITLELRKLMLDSAYEKDLVSLVKDLSNILTKKDELTNQALDNLRLSLKEIVNHKEITLPARELISQAIRSIHINKVIYPALLDYDFIIQDRGILSGMAYGVACGNSFEFIETLSTKALGNKNSTIKELYDQVILFEGNVANGLKRALSAKQEFKDGDAMENKGISFLEKVNNNFKEYKKHFKNVKSIAVDNKSIEDISKEVDEILKI